MRLRVRKECQMVASSLFGIFYWDEATDLEPVTR